MLNVEVQIFDRSDALVDDLNNYRWRLWWYKAPDHLNLKLIDMMRINCQSKKIKIHFFFKLNLRTSKIGQASVHYVDNVF